MAIAIELKRGDLFTTHLAMARPWNHHSSLNTGQMGQFRTSNQTRVGWTMTGTF